MQRLTRDVLSFLVGAAVTAGAGVRVVGLDFVEDKVKQAFATPNATATAEPDVPVTREGPTPTTAPPEPTSTPAETTCHHERKSDPLPEDPTESEKVSGKFLSRTVSTDGKTAAYVYANEWFDTQTLYFGSRNNCGEFGLTRSATNRTIEVMKFENQDIVLEINGTTLCTMGAGDMFCRTTSDAPDHVLRAK